MAATGVVFLSSSNVRQSQPALASAKTSTAAEGNADARASERPPERKAAAVTAHRRRQAHLLAVRDARAVGAVREQPEHGRDRHDRPEAIQHVGADRLDLAVQEAGVVVVDEPAVLDVGVEPVAVLLRQVADVRAGRRSGSPRRPRSRSRASWAGAATSGPRASSRCRAGRRCRSRSPPCRSSRRGSRACRARPRCDRRAQANFPSMIRRPPDSRARDAIHPFCDGSSRSCAGWRCPA